jgi:transcription-repair coupling factor (superfamily II helicase)
VERAERSEVRIDLPVDAHLPDDYLEDQSARLEAYRRLALAENHDQVEDVGREWLDRFGPLPGAALALLDVARLRVEALRVGLDEIVKLRDEVRLAKVDLSASQEVRLSRIAPRAVLRAGEGVIFLPAPPDGRIVADLLAFLVEMWPPLPEGEGKGSPSASQGRVGR